MTQIPPDALDDSREHITPHNFRVATHLYGLPLASPWRRALAIALDGLLLAILVEGGGLAIGLMFAVFLFAAWRDRRRSPDPRTTSGLSFRSLSAVLVMVGLVALSNQFWPDDDHDAAPARHKTAGVSLSASQGAAFGVALARLHACPDAACRELAIDAIARPLADAHAEPGRALEVVDGLIDEIDDLPAESAASLKRRAAAKFAGAAAAPAAGPAPPAPTGVPLPAPSTDAATEMPEVLPPKERRNPFLGAGGGFSVMATLHSLVDDLGINAGWAALYFTLFTWLWNGQTPGKKLFGIRVIHLRGRPLTWWDAFGRFGGYAAGLATGLLGFAQVFWDSNRQAIHDQVSFTAVIRDGDGRTLQRAMASAAPVD